MALLRLIVVIVSVAIVYIGLINGIPDECLQPKIEGPCKGYFPRYFYNTATSVCEKFIYGGCWENDNNFETIEACKALCVA